MRSLNPTTGPCGSLTKRAMILAMEGVMRILDEAAGGNAPPEFMSTHPKPENRVEYIEAALKKYFPQGVPEGLRP